MTDGDKNRDPNQDAVDQVKQRGLESTVDLGEEPNGDQADDGVTQDADEPNDYSGDVEDTVDTNVTEPSDEVDPEA